MNSEEVNPQDIVGKTISSVTQSDDTLAIGFTDDTIFIITAGYYDQPLLGFSLVKYEGKDEE